MSSQGARVSPVAGSPGPMYSSWPAKRPRGIGKGHYLDRTKIRDRQSALKSSVERSGLLYDDAQKGGFDGSRRDFQGVLSYTLYAERAKRATGRLPFGKPEPQLDQALRDGLNIEDRPLPPTRTETAVTAPPVALDNGKNLVSEAPKKEEPWLKIIREAVAVLLDNKEPTPEFKEYEELVRRKAKRDEEIEKLKSGKDEKRNFPELDEEALKKVQEALGPGKGAVANKFNIAVQKSDIATLRDGQWLNDEVINFYGQLIMERAKTEPDKYPKVHVFNTNFFSLLRDQGYKSVQRWTRKYDVFSFDYVLIPVHWSMHWCFAAINFKKKRIEYYDSLHGSDQNCVALLRDYLERESMDKKKRPFDLSGWEDYIPKSIPAQKNGYDCGVFSCMFADYVSREEVFDFSQTHMKYFRNRMIYEIVSTKLML